MTAAAISYRQTPEQTTCLLAGDWRADARIPEAALPSWQAGVALDFDCSALGDWDSSLLARVLQIIGAASAAGCTVDLSGLPGGLVRLVRLAKNVPRQDHPAQVHENGVLAYIGQVAMTVWSRIPQSLTFVGELSRSLARLATGKVGFQRTDLLHYLEDAGPRALPIVSLISFLVGTILAYMGAAQLAMFGAQIYIANLVGVGMIREIAALMTAIILAGRTGAAYAAQLGTMQVNEEIDALRTFGMQASDFLVLPRFLALVAMAPLLTLYAGLVGIVAGMLIATTVFDIGVYAYYTQTLQALTLTHIAVGLIKGTVYGALVAIAGCLCGMRCGRSAQAVGEATTAAVVLGILLITISASLLTILFQRLGI